MIDVFITHFVPSGYAHAHGFNEILVDELLWVQRVTDRQDYRLTVVYCIFDETIEQHLRAITPPGVRLVKNDRPGRRDIQPSQRNKVLDVAREEGTELMVLLHNDVRVSRGWLDRLVADLKHAETVHGRGQAIVAPRYIPYQYVDGPKGDESFWVMMRETKHVLSKERMAAWCSSSGFSMAGDEVVCPPWRLPSADGHQLMMWIARPEFFSDLGECDETFTGVNHDDQDWGIRALLTGKTSYQSQTALVGHVEGLTFSRKLAAAPEDALLPRADSTQVFVRKWGQALFDEMQTGKLWSRLHAWHRRGPLDVADMFQLVTGGLGVGSVVDVGTGRNGVVGLHSYWERLPGQKIAVDIHAIKSLPKDWLSLIMDARGLLARLGPKSVDVVQACDFIEHLPKADALRMLKDFEAIARKAVLIFTPIAPPGGTTPSPAEATEPDNPYQRHLCGFTYAEFEDLGYTTGRRILENMWRESSIVAWKTF